MGAVAAGRQAVVQVLLSTPDVNLNVRDKYGHTTLFEARKRGYTEISIFC